MGWGWSLAWGFGGLSLVMVGYFLLFTWRCLAPEGSRLPLVRACFVLGFNLSGVGFFGFLSQKKIILINKFIKLGRIRA